MSNKETLRDWYEKYQQQYGYDSADQHAKQAIEDLGLDSVQGEFLFEPLFQHAQSWIDQRRRTAEKSFVKAEREYKDKKRSSLSPEEVKRAAERKQKAQTTLYGESFFNGAVYVNYADATIPDFEGAIEHTQQQFVRPLQDKIDFWKKCIQQIKEAGVKTWGEVPQS